MSATKEITIRIQCENCGEWEQMPCNSVATARSELKEKGWSSKRADGKVLDYCPQCTQITLMYKRRKSSAD